MVFYTDAQAVHLYRTGNETIPTSVGSAIYLLRQKLGICCLIFARRRVGILETLTHPRQTRQGAEVRSVVEESVLCCGCPPGTNCDPERTVNWHMR